MHESADRETPKTVYRGLPEADAAALVVRYQQGDHAALARLHDELRPAILAALRRYRATELPATLTFQDIEQQSWIVLADLAARWKPSGSFLAYFFQSFSHDISRFVQQTSPSRRTRSVQVITLPHDDLLTKMEHLPDVNVNPHRDEDALRLTADLTLDVAFGSASYVMMDLAMLPARRRAAFLLRTLEGHDFTTIGRLLQVSRTSAHRFYHQALDQLRRSESGVQGLALRARGCQPDAGPRTPESGLHRLVHLLHVTAGPDGRLAGRRRVVEAAGLGRSEYAALIAQLEAAGAIVGRAPTRAGRLVEPTPQATLRRVLGAES